MFPLFAILVLVPAAFADPMVISTPLITPSPSPTAIIPFEAQEIPLRLPNDYQPLPDRVLAMPGEPGQRAVFVALTPDGKKLVGVGTKIFIWEVGTWILLKSFSRLSAGERGPLSPTSITISSDQKKIGIYSYEQSGSLVEVYSLETGALEKKLPATERGIREIQFLKDSSKLLTSNQGWGSVYDLTTSTFGENIQGPYLPKSWVLTSDGKPVAVRGFKEVQIYPQNSPASTKKIPADYSHDFANYEDRLIAFSTPDHFVAVWDLKSEKEVVLLKGSRVGLLTMRFSGDGKTLFAVNEEGEVFYWTLENSRLQSKLSVGYFPVDSVFSSDGKYLFVGKAAPRVEIWEIEKTHAKELKGDRADIVQTADGLLEAKAKNGWKQLGDWIHVRRMAMIDTMAIRREYWRKSGSEPPQTDEAKLRYLRALAVNANNEEKACVFEFLTYDSSNALLITELLKLKIVDKGKAHQSHDMVLDEYGSQIRDYAIANFPNTQCGKAMGLKLIDRLNTIECGLTEERLDEQMGNLNRLLASYKLSNDEKALVYMNLAEQYRYAFAFFKGANAKLAELHKAKAVETLRKITELFPETRQLTQSQIDTLLKGLVEDVGGCEDMC